MPERNRTKTIATFAAVALTVFICCAAAGGIPDQLPDPEGKAPNAAKPVKVYILMD